MKAITLEQLQVIWQYFDDNQIAQLRDYLPEEQEEVLNEINEKIDFCDLWRKKINEIENNTNTTIQ